ncbi:hypothetical protein JCM6882_003302 [Rhodosporidiobolus microsporus]
MLLSTFSAAKLVALSALSTLASAQAFELQYPQERERTNGRQTNAGPILRSPFPLTVSGPLLLSFENSSSWDVLSVAIVWDADPLALASATSAEGGGSVMLPNGTTVEYERTVFNQTQFEDSGGGGEQCISLSVSNSSMAKTYGVGGEPAQVLQNGTVGTMVVQYTGLNEASRVADYACADIVLVQDFTPPTNVAGAVSGSGADCVPAGAVVQPTSATAGGGNGGNGASGMRWKAGAMGAVVGAVGVVALFA